MKLITIVAAYVSRDWWSAALHNLNQSFNQSVSQLINQSINQYSFFIYMWSKTD